MQLIRFTHVCSAEPGRQTQTVLELIPTTPTIPFGKSKQRGGIPVGLWIPKANQLALIAWKAAASI